MPHRPPRILNLGDREGATGWKHRSYGFSAPEVQAESLFAARSQQVSIAFWASGSNAADGHGDQQGAPLAA
jgi:hypothetical protein